MMDHYTLTVLHKLHNLPTPAFKQGEADAHDTLVRIQRGLTNSVRDLEMMVGWCRYTAYQRSRESAQPGMDVFIANRLRGASVAYQDMADELERKLSTLKGQIQELAMVMDL